MAEKEKHTEDKIAAAAREVFVEKGMAGARMQEIADRAGINKSLLHYYFRSKEKLFNFVLSKILGHIGEMFGNIVHDDVSIEDKLKVFVGTYIDILLKNPFLPNFIFNEIIRNPDGIVERFVNAKIEPSLIFKPLSVQLKKEGYNIGPTDFVINALSLVIFPIAIKPLIQKALFGNDKMAYRNYILSRKESVVKFILNALEAYRNG